MDIILLTQICGSIIIGFMMGVGSYVVPFKKAEDEHYTLAELAEYENFKERVMMYFRKVINHTDNLFKKFIATILLEYRL